MWARTRFQSEAMGACSWKAKNCHLRSSAHIMDTVLTGEDGHARLSSLLEMSDVVQSAPSTLIRSTFDQPMELCMISLCFPSHFLAVYRVSILNKLQVLMDRSGRRCRRTERRGRERSEGVSADLFWLSRDVSTMKRTRPIWPMGCRS